jgi:hypothetical protein
MLGQFEEKGKIYTPIINKEQLDVVIHVHTQRILGKVHVRQGERLKDQIGQDERYLAVTDATVFDLNGTLLYSIGFIAINHTNILWIAPFDEVSSPGESSHE